MERKIGEIFEYNDEWYQCIESDNCRCDDCDFDELGDCDIIACASGERKDGKEVYFKKLEKVGEPYELYGHLVQKYRFFHSPAIQVNGNCISKTINTDNIIKIEIKQNKEDMGDNADIRPYDELFSPSTVSNTKHLAKEEMEENKLNLKPFDIQKAKEGKPVCTRDGRKARIICWDRYASCYHIVALIECKGFPNKEEEVKVYTDNGKYISGEENAYDLMMSPKSTKDG